MGRRPSGVCGACLILSARMHNYRRTIKEIVYIVKVTSATIQKRLDEFKLTPSSRLTIKDFLNNELLEQQHDPPSYYEKQPEFLVTKTTKKRKRKGIVESEEEEGSDKRQRSAEPEAPLRRDADGFAIPAPPRNKDSLTSERNIPDIVDEVLSQEQSGGESLSRLVEAFDGLIPESDPHDQAGLLFADASEAVKRSARRSLKASITTAIHPPEAWMNDDKVLEDLAAMASEDGTGVDDSGAEVSGDIPDGDDDDQVLESLNAQNEPLSEDVSDPSSTSHQIRYRNACKKARAYMKQLEAAGLWKNISMDPIISPDEFINDPDVENCMVDPQAAAVKERIWVNANKDYLFEKLRKDHEKRVKENDPGRKRRNRQKRPRIGEGVAPAATPEEASAAMLERHSFSKKLNYNKINADTLGSLTNIAKYGSQAQGSPGTSRATSAAPSTILISDDDDQSATTSVRGDSVAPSVRENSVVPSVAESGVPDEDDAEAGAEANVEAEADVDEIDEDEENDENNFMKHLQRPREDGEDQEDDYGGGYDDYDDVPAGDDDVGGGYVSAEEFDD